MVHLPSAVLGNDRSLLTLGESGEIMAWFYPDKDAFQNVRSLLPCFYFDAPRYGVLRFTFDEEWQRSQFYDGESNVLVTELFAPNFGLRARFTDCFCGELDPFAESKNDDAVLLRHLEITNEGATRLVAGAFHLGEFRVGGQEKGSGIRYDFQSQILVQSHREAALAIGGDALESWQCGKWQAGWSSNARDDLRDGALNRQDLEIGEVNCAFGFDFDLEGGGSVEKTFAFSLAPREETARENLSCALQISFEEHLQTRRATDARWLAVGLQSLQRASTRGVKNQSENASRNFVATRSLQPEMNAAAVGSDEAQNERRVPRNAGEPTARPYDAKRENDAPQDLSYAASTRKTEREHDAPQNAGEMKTEASARAENMLRDFGAGASTRGKNQSENPPQDFTGSASTRELADGNGDAPRAEKSDFDAAQIALPDDLFSAYRRCLLCLPLLCGQSGAAVAAPEFDPDFLLCGGYGYCWPRDGAEYAAGLFEAGYESFVPRFLDWCAQHQDERGLWHQRYFLNGAVGPNWCLPPDTLQIDQVGAVLWLAGKYADEKTARNFAPAVRRAADYLLSRLDENGVHKNAFDTWETFVGSFTYSNAAIYAALKAAARVLADEKYAVGAARVKNAVLQNFVRNNGEYSFLVRGLDARGGADETLDSASLGAIEPFELLDLENESELELALGLLRAITEKLEVDWEGGRAIRRFENDAYVGGVPACVNTLWMARCCLRVAFRLREIGREDGARVLAGRAQTFLQTVLRRATPTGLLPELMQGPDGARWWAAPHGWAMASFCSGVLQLAQFNSQAPSDVK